MGALTVASHDATDQDRKGLQQSTLQFGGGLERRWTHFAIELELRAVGVAPAKGADGQPMASTTFGDSTSQPPSGPTMTPGDGWSGGEMVLSGNYYF
jgi:hypothetical protein